MNVILARRHPPNRRFARVNPALGALAGEISAFVLLAPLLLACAFWNGFPLIYYDTGAYVLEGLGWHFLAERSPAYSLFLRFARADLSLWTIVAIQACATAFVMVEAARAVAPRMRLFAFLVLCVVLVGATGLPWYTGEVEPDSFAAVAAIAFYLVAFRRAALGQLRIVALLFVGAFAAAAHISHLLLIAGLFVFLALYFAARLLARAGAAWPKPNLAGTGIMVGLALSLVIASNYAFTRQVFLSRAGPAFLFARLLQDRIVTRLLDETCPQSGYRLCAYRDVLPPTANAWLWAPYSPFFKLGGFAGTRQESERIVLDSLARYPWQNLRSLLVDSALQFVSFKTGDQVEPQQWALRPVFSVYLPSQLGSYLTARQQRGQIGFRSLNAVHVPLGYASLLAMAGLFALAMRRAERDQSVFLATVLLALLGNAVICGGLSNPHDRYQSRLMWMGTFAACLVAGANGFGARREP